MVYDHIKEWDKAYVGHQMMYPAEYVIRIFKGSFPRLDLDKASFNSKKICDVGCGDGRNLVLLKQCGFDLYGVEISEEIVEKVKSDLASLGIEADIRVGDNYNIPFGDDFFDYVLSWNVCYYMGKQTNFSSHVKELARVIKPEGFLVLSIPKKTCYIFEGSEELKRGYQVIRNDPFKTRNGEVLKMFENEEEISDEFSSYFKEFVWASIHDDCFGFNYHWHLVVCRKF
jgi:SAM-dependent methyltransferase